MKVNCGSKCWGRIFNFRSMWKHFPKNNPSIFGQCTKWSVSSTTCCGELKVIRLLDIQEAWRGHITRLNYIIQNLEIEMINHGVIWKYVPLNSKAVNSAKSKRHKKGQINWAASERCTVSDFDLQKAVWVRRGIECRWEITLKCKVTGVMAGDSVFFQHPCIFFNNEGVTR